MRGRVRAMERIHFQVQSSSSVGFKAIFFFTCQFVSSSDTKRPGPKLFLCIWS